MRRVAIAVLFAVTQVEPLAHAQVGSGDEARQLFDSALTDMRSGNWGAACPKLEKGLAIEPGLGMKFNLALCYENIGRIGTAYGLFQSVAAEAADKRKADRERSAREHLVTLQPIVPFLSIAVPASSRVEGLEIFIDGARLDPRRWGTGMPMDPGDHRLEFSAPGRRSQVMVRRFERAGGTFALEVGILDVEVAPSPPVRSSSFPAPAPAAASTAPSYLAASQRAESDGIWSTPRGFAVGFGTLAVAGFVIGGVYGLRAYAGYDRSNAAGCDGNRCNASAASIREDAMRDGNWSTLAFVTGSSALVGAATLWFAGAPDRKRIGLGAPPGSSTAGLSLKGAW